MKYRSMCVTLLAGAILLCMGACTAAETNGNNWNKDNISTDNTEILTITQTPSKDLSATPVVTDTPAEEITLSPTPVPEKRVPVLTSLCIEAGTELGIPDFFASLEDIPEEEGIFTVSRELTAKELRQAGAVYELPVSYDGQDLTVTVEIIDTTPPVIEGAKDIEVFEGDTISYKRGIELSDNAEGEISLSVENDEVDLDTSGSYVVRYMATDASGNCSVSEITVFVRQRSDKEEVVNQLADALIQELITEGMSKWDICYKLWNWCRTKISYSYSAGDRSSIYAGAYEGLHDRSGDCYAYYATFTLLLQKCEIETMEVRRVGGTSDHWWNLVNLGNGWYHCDSSPRRKKDTYRCFMQTDTQIQAYTDSRPEHPNYYVFDETLYPERATEIVYGK